MRAKVFEPVADLAGEQREEFFVQQLGVELADAEGGTRAVGGGDLGPCLEGVKGEGFERGGEYG